MTWGLPDIKGAFIGFYDERIKPTIDHKSTEFKELLKENFARGANVQQAVIILALALFLLLALSFFWVDQPNNIQWKYLLLGTLIAFTTRYVLSLKPWEFGEKLVK